MAKEYIIQGFYPDNEEFRVEVTAYQPCDVIILAQGALKVSKLERTVVIDASTGEKIAFFSNYVTVM